MHHELRNEHRRHEPSCDLPAASVGREKPLRDRANTRYGVMKPTSDVAPHAILPLLCSGWLLLAGIAAAQPPEVDLDELARRDPAAAALLDLPRDSAAAQLRVIFGLIDLGHEEAAQSVLGELAARDVSDDEKTALVERFGTARLLRLLRQTGPGGAIALPAGREFVAGLLQTASDRARDPVRLSEAIAGLAEPGLRRAAQKRLVAAGEAGIQAAVARLAENPPPAVRAALLETLAAMRPRVNEAVLALAAESDGSLRSDATRLAGRLNLLDALPWIAVQSVGVAGPEAQAAAREALDHMDLPTPQPSEAAELIRRRLAEASRLPASGVETSTPRTWWTYNAQQKRLETLSVTPAQARALHLARLARALEAVADRGEPGDRAERLLYAWEAAATLDEPAEAVVAQRWDQQSPEELDRLLESALDRQLLTAAAHAASLLGDKGDASLLTSLDGQPRPLAQALKSADDRVRFAALQAILKLQAGGSFAGASYVVDTLWYFAAGGGDPTALAAAGTLARANLWAGQLRSLGYDAVAATTGREALSRVLDPTRAARLGVVLVDSEISLPGVREVVFQIRRNAKTGRTPIAILSSVPQLRAMERLAENDPWVIAEPRPHGAGATAALVERLKELPAPEMPDEQVRTERARFALKSIAELLQRDASSDQLRRDVELAERALYQAELSAAAMEVLRHAGTTGSQLALADYLSAGSLPLEARKAAAEAFRQSVVQFGVQLPPEAIRRQYARYNASENAEPDTQALLSGVLDAIEAK